MNNKRKLVSGMNVGSSSILVTFVLLCLVTFAALSFVSANSDHRLSLQAAQRMSAYYDANHMADVFLLNIDKQLNSLSEEADDKEAYFREVENTFSDNSSILIDNRDDNCYLSYEIVISDYQKLCVELLVTYPESNDSNTYIINKWETIPTYNGKEGTMDDGMGFIF